MKEQLIEWYLDYFNNFISVREFAAQYGVDRLTATQIIGIGRRLHLEAIVNS